MSQHSRFNGRNAIATALLAGVSLVGFVGCGNSGTSFSLLSQSQSFQQATGVVNNKIDILWVVDDSSSMTDLQQNLVNNFGSFMTNFVSKGFDYHLAVTSTAAYLGNAAYAQSVDYDPNLAKFSDGAPGNTSGIYVINSTTVNPINVFVQNASLGAAASGDERAFSSILEAVGSPMNAGFLRPGAFFATIILSDEDDFSDPTRQEYSWLNGGIPDHDYNDPNLLSTNDMLASLDQLTGTTDPNKRFYNVSAIAVTDQACLTSHQAQSSASIMGTRYMALANATDGILGSVCDVSYASTLNFIQQKIVELSTEFMLNGSVDPSTIVVYVNSVFIPQDPTNGWTYDAVQNGIIFHGTAVPPESANVQIGYEPTQLH